MTLAWHSEGVPCVEPKLSLTKVQQTLSNLMILPQHVKLAIQNWFRHCSSAVLNSSVRFGTWAVSELGLSFTARNPKVWSLLIYSHFSYRFNPIRGQLSSTSDWHVCMKECVLIKVGHIFQLDWMGLFFSPDNKWILPLVLLIKKTQVLPKW